jgi:hypothetical protein
MNAKIEVLTQQNNVRAMEARAVETRSFVLSGIDGTTKHIIDEIFGKNFVKWMLAVTKFLFTEQELIDSTLEPTTRSSRGHLDEGKVATMREALSFKYKLTPEKFDRAWAATRQAINNKGRNLALRQRARRLVRTVVRTVSNLSLRNAAE